MVDVSGCERLQRREVGLTTTAHNARCEVSAVGGESAHWN